MGPELLFTALNEYMYRNHLDKSKTTGVLCLDLNTLAPNKISTYDLQIGILSPRSVLLDHIDGRVLDVVLRYIFNGLQHVSPVGLRTDLEDVVNNIFQEYGSDNTYVMSDEVYTQFITAVEMDVEIFSKKYFLEQYHYISSTERGLCIVVEKISCRYSGSSSRLLGIFRIIDKGI